SEKTPGGNDNEANLTITLTPDVGATIAKALGTTYDVRVNITSAMPPQGVEVTVIYKKDSDNSVVFSQTQRSSANQINFTITNIPFNEVGTVTVTAKSVSKPSNTATASFKLTRK
ncbi:MAG TPA: hypothetical protein VHK69_21005, partial [Chitinophagaceae bacterium]|nr:hypothetical protein [Chitinophagaceae bacterium]